MKLGSGGKIVRVRLAGSRLLEDQIVTGDRGDVADPVLGRGPIVVGPTAVPHEGRQEGTIL